MPPRPDSSVAILACSLSILPHGGWPVQRRRRRGSGYTSRDDRFVNSFFKEYDQATDRDLFVNLMTKFGDDIDPAYSSFFATVADKYKNDFNRFADKMYAKSFLVDADRCAEFIANPRER